MYRLLLCNYSFIQFAFILLVLFLFFHFSNLDQIEWKIKVKCEEKNTNFISNFLLLFACNFLLQSIIIVLEYFSTFGVVFFLVLLLNSYIFLHCAWIMQQNKGFIFHIMVYRENNTKINTHSHSQLYIFIVKSLSK